MDWDWDCWAVVRVRRVAKAAVVVKGDMVVVWFGLVMVEDGDVETRMLRLF